MNYILSLILISSMIVFGSYEYNGSTTAAVVLSGGIIKSKHIETNQKYKRKDCPVCKGKGWYISGDGIAKVDCGYCEPEKKDGAPAYDTRIITHPPAVLKPNCISGTCNSVRK